MPTATRLMPRTSVPPSVILPIAALLAIGCTVPTTRSDRGENGPAAGGISGSVPHDQPASVGTCTQDTPHPRSLLRLSGPELLNTLRAALPAPLNLDEIQGTDALSVTRHIPDPALVVSRDTQTQLDTLASGIADATVRHASQILSCPVRDFGNDAPCTLKLIETWAGALFHTRVEAEDTERLLTLARTIAQRSSGEKALHTTVRALILSPRTLYLTEGFENQDVGGTTTLSAEERAAFLAYRITGAPPVPTLKAELANVNDVAELRRRIVENFSASQLQRAASSFVHGWLGTDAISNLTRDPRKHPDFDANARKRLLDESTDAIARIFTNGEATLTRILTEPLRSELAGDGTGSGDPLDDGYARHGRPGLFLLPGVIASVSNLDHTDIPRRGRFLLRRLFCDTVPSPPANLAQMQPPLTGTPSERARFERIEREPSCRGCHVRVDGLGFALEGYDELGRARTHDEHGNPILTDGRHAIDGHPDLVFSDARDLFTQAARHPVVESCLSVQVFRHLARRVERENADACLINETTAAGRRNSFDIVELFVDTLARLTLAPRAL